jgi:hypothetical protein
MRKLRVSVAGLMAVVAFFGVGLAASVSPRIVGDTADQLRA